MVPASYIKHDLIVLILAYFFLPVFETKTLCDKYWASNRSSLGLAECSSTRPRFMYVLEKGHLLFSFTIRNSSKPLRFRDAVTFENSFFKIIAIVFFIFVYILDGATGPRSLRASSSLVVRGGKIKRKFVDLG